MAAAVIPAQEEYVSGDVTRRLAVFNDATTASLQGVVEESRVGVANQLVMEKRDISIASQAFEERIVSTINATIDERSSVLNEQLTAAFVCENTEIRKAVESMTTVMEAIGGKKLQEVAAKMADLDKSQSQNVALLRNMFGTTSNELRDWMLAHERSFQEALGRLGCLEHSARVDLPRNGGSSRLKIPGRLEA